MLIQLYSQVSRPIKVISSLCWMEAPQNQTEDLKHKPCVQNSTNKLLHAPNRCFPFQVNALLWIMLFCFFFFFPSKRKYQHAQTQASS